MNDLHEIQKQYQLILENKLQSKLTDFYNKMSEVWQTIDADTMYKNIIEHIPTLEIQKVSKKHIIDNATKIYKLGKAKNVSDYNIRYRLLDYLGKSINKFETLQTMK